MAANLDKAALEELKKNKVPVSDFLNALTLCLLRHRHHNYQACRTVPRTVQYSIQAVLRHFASTKEKRKQL